ncbi:ABC transporter ATP-binding protein [Rathayibacter rathayi]|uniref:ABC transporter ATP-binding protein n=1 Tax=Rathayibacter rathayi TaxID=33887 RepID=UPI00215875C5|nr:ATP-binding cassette domain-containing protein [Rathayibacter rathayi]
MLSAQGVDFSYDSRTPILTNWSGRFDPGEVVAVTGASGRGKSTLLYLLGLMLRPQSGSVLVGGVSVAGMNDALRSRLRAEVFGFVFQDAALDPTRTVLDNVLETTLYRHERRAEAIPRARELLTRFGVDLRASATPGRVSGGQAQRIALCRALLNRPKILLADEPTGNLDPVTARAVVTAFHEHARTGATVIVVTHDPELVAGCSRNVML